MTRPNTDHVVCDAQDGGAFRCLHCGDHHAPSFRQPLAVFCESAKGYALMHKHCQPKPEPSKQVPLFDANGHEARSASYSTTVVPLGAAQGIDGMSDEPDPETDPPGHTVTNLDNDELDADGQPLPPPAYPQFAAQPIPKKKKRGARPLTSKPGKPR